MKLPIALRDKKEWVLVGPMGPELDSRFSPCPILAVDGGIHFTEKANFWIGDHDSSGGAKIEIPSLDLSPRKDRSDLACALELFVDEAAHKFHLWGFSGGRKDHELFVFGECLKFLQKKEGTEILLYSAKGGLEFHFISKGEWTFQSQGLFTLGCLTPAQITLSGACEYPLLEKTTLSPLSSLGLSNSGQGECLLTTDSAMFIYFPGPS